MLHKRKWDLYSLENGWPGAAKAPNLRREGYDMPHAQLRKAPDQTQLLGRILELREGWVEEGGVEVVVTTGLDCESADIML